MKSFKSWMEFIYIIKQNNNKKRKKMNEIAITVKDI